MGKGNPCLPWATLLYPDQPSAEKLFWHAASCWSEEFLLLEHRIECKFDQPGQPPFTARVTPSANSDHLQQHTRQAEASRNTENTPTAQP